MFATLNFLALLAVVAGQQWAIDTTTTATYVIGVGSNGANSAVAAGAINGVGSIVESYDGAKWTKTTVPSLMVMGAAISSNGVTVAPGMGHILVSTDGVNYVSTSAKGIAQTADVYGSNRDKLAVAGGWQTTNPSTGRPTDIYGVAYSSDNGATFSISGSVPDGYVRYGAYPSDDVWYVSSGIWGEDPKVEGKARPLSSRLRLDSNKITYTMDRRANYLKAKDSNSTTGWFGSVSKSTDGGKSWSQVLTTNIEEDYLYFNEISCGSELNCIVVGEGDSSSGGYLTVAYVTFDGGKTWDKTFSSSDYVSLSAVSFVSGSTAWIAPTKKNGRTLTGDFYKTTDGGKTFTLIQSVDNCYSIDVDFSSDGSGYAACLSSSGSSGSVAEYK